mgnify:CR=1 FL=1
MYDDITRGGYGEYYNRNNSVVIERAEVNMNVQRLANDYDARRAGDQIMDQMLTIARKTQASNRIGR